MSVAVVHAWVMSHASSGLISTHALASVANNRILLILPVLLFATSLVRDMGLVFFCSRHMMCIDIFVLTLLESVIAGKYKYRLGVIPDFSSFKKREAFFKPARDQSSQEDLFCKGNCNAEDYSNF